MAKIPGMTVMAPEEITLADLRQWAEATPGCEVHPAYDSDETCGDPSIGHLYCRVLHVHPCELRKNTEAYLWVCAHHFMQAKAGKLVCVDCKGPVRVVRIN
jgi:hypothetical protein